MPKFPGKFCRESRNIYYIGQSENKFSDFISGYSVELVECHCVLCPQAAFLVCSGTYDLHRAGGAGAVLC
jgi:hypothetical protein